VFTASLSLKKDSRPLEPFSKNLIVIRGSFLVGLTASITKGGQESRFHIFKFKHVVFESCQKLMFSRFQAFAVTLSGLEVKARKLEVHVPALRALQGDLEEALGVDLQLAASLFFDIRSPVRVEHLPQRV
jgi:hypothetical protein